MLIFFLNLHAKYCNIRYLSRLSFYHIEHSANMVQLLTSD